MASPILAAIEPARTFGFRRVLCAVNGSPNSEEAAHQASLLVDEGGALTFLAVTDAEGSLDARHATEVAQAAAAVEAVASTTAVVCDRDVNTAILDAAGNADLLVLGAHGRSRLAGIMLGGTTARALHSSSVPVLVARLRADLAFPGTVLVGLRGVADRHATLIAATIASRHGARVALAHCGPPGPEIRATLTDLAADAREITGHEPIVLTVDGPPADRLPAMAASIGAGLLVLGSRGLTGVRALASVSEQVAHRAPCSVLVLRSEQLAENYGRLAG